MDDNSALYRAIKGEKTEAVRNLIRRGVSLNGTDCTPLHLAVERGHEGIIQALLEAKANVNAKGKSGYTPLHLSVFSSQAVVRLLLASGAKVNAKDFHGNTVLHYAADLTNGFELTKIFIEAGASLHERNARGLTALHCAAGKGSVTLVKYLILVGADVNSKDTKAQTPLHIALRCDKSDSHLATIEVLLENGADVFGRNDRGLVPLQCLKNKQGSEESKISDVLIKHMKNFSSGGKERKEYKNILESLKVLDKKISDKLKEDENAERREKLEKENKDLKQKISAMRKNMEKLIKSEAES